MHTLCTSHVIEYIDYQKFVDITSLKQLYLGGEN